MQHTCFILNYSANASLAYAIPMTLLTGVTQDISPMLQFEWYEPVYYREEEAGFPSTSIERYGRFVGIAETVGHAMTFMVLAEDTQRILYRSVVRTATDPASENLRASGYPDGDPPQVVHSHIDDKIAELADGEASEGIHMPIIHPEELTGRTF